MNTLRVQSGEVALSSSFLASCPLAVAYALFDVHTLQPAAQAVFGQRVARIDHLGSFACRNIYNRANSRLSQHASANALDIAGFRLADGQRINLLKDWSDSGDKGRFLRLIRDGACKNFSTVLGRTTTPRIAITFIWTWGGGRYASERRATSYTLSQIRVAA